MFSIVILFWVRVPVLSEQMQEVDPSVSTDSISLTKHFLSLHSGWCQRQGDSDRDRSPSGTLATMIPIAKTMFWVNSISNWKSESKEQEVRVQLRFRDELDESRDFIFQWSNSLFSSICHTSNLTNDSLISNVEDHSFASSSLAHGAEEGNFWSPRFCLGLCIQDFGGGAQILQSGRSCQLSFPLPHRFWHQLEYDLLHSRSQYLHRPVLWSIDQVFLSVSENFAFGWNEIFKPFHDWFRLGVLEVGHDSCVVMTRTITIPKYMLEGSVGAKSIDDETQDGSSPHQEGERSSELSEKLDPPGQCLSCGEGVVSLLMVSLLGFFTGETVVKMVSSLTSSLLHSWAHVILCWSRSLMESFDTSGLLLLSIFFHPSLLGDASDLGLSVSFDPEVDLLRRLNVVPYQGRTRLNLFCHYAIIH